MTDEHTLPANRTVIVTGAASARGIGRAVAHRLAAAGWSVGIIDLGEEAAAEAARQVAAATSAEVTGYPAECLTRQRSTPPYRPSSGTSPRSSDS